MKSFEQIEREALAEGQEWTRKRIEEKIKEERSKAEKRNRHSDGFFPPRTGKSDPPADAHDHDPDVRGEG